jgi:hypothetical protein
MAQDERRDNFKDIRDARKRLLLRFDAERDIVEVKPAKGPPVRVDLTEYRRRKD